MSRQRRTQKTKQTPGEAALEAMFKQAQAQFGSAVKAHWFYDGPGCPGCSREIDAVKIKGKEAISVNGFMYRKRGVLIGYVLCGQCATHIFQEAKKNPYTQTPLHATIEANLIEAYTKYLGRLDA